MRWLFTIGIGLTAGVSNQVLGFDLESWQWWLVLAVCFLSYLAGRTREAMFPAGVK